MTTVGLVSRTQAEGWEIPFVLSRQPLRSVTAHEVVEGARSLPEDELSALLEAIVRVCWSNFFTLPVALSSPEGQKILHTWMSLRARLSSRGDFVWRFWSPERDAQAAEFIRVATGQLGVWHSVH